MVVKDIIGSNVRMRNVEVRGGLNHLYVELPAKFIKANALGVGSQLVMFDSETGIILLPTQ